jgi:hypothetical protein
MTKLCAHTRVALPIDCCLTTNFCVIVMVSFIIGPTTS